jgi:hypothetical protein
MTKEEFSNECIAIDKNYKIPTDSDYELIENVYLYHPSIMYKSKAAKLYIQFGMTTIKDMQERCNIIKRLEQEIMKQNSILDELKSNLKNYMEA